MDLVQIATCELASILDRLFSAQAVNWWDDFVWRYLNDRQRAVIACKANPTLQDLDLASLLAVLDANWSRLGKAAAQSHEARNYLMELKTIRNQLCHQTSRIAPAEIAVRQWQTLKLFLESIGGSEPSIRLINAELLRLVKSYQSELTRGPQRLLAS